MSTYVPGAYTVVGESHFFNCTQQQAAGDNL